ncbi:FG-GAP repeat domain-containing protein [Coprinellus micaceus]|uniref:FG-GAP repeat domain-containing protein n=1 Tax=Coprinellus micaceus TaxID=71717 RepID=A0A4Y7SIZ4_COPMI|nr:FG-GAP repeat domain-containing protein [Coprinellus micaceus]TEB29052.1 FG-GAP repeat domain-containing protein [Coprinellus micaceus]
MRALFGLAVVAALLTPALILAKRTYRIMPLGASITYGVGSTHGNGYRDRLFRLLERNGNVVNMVGTHPAGECTMEDKDTEGWSGFIIDEVAAKMRASMPVNRPNIATILVGTNDMTRNIDARNAPARLGGLIDELLNFPSPTLVIVSSLPANGNPEAQERIEAYNDALRGVVRRRLIRGRRVIFADCGRLAGVSDLVDGTHPNDAAYERIGDCLHDAIVEGERRGWIAPAQGPEP